jgi:hypothetical protein
MSEKTVLQGRRSSQFYLDDKRIEQCPRFDTRGNRVKNQFTYHMMQVVQALWADMGDHEFGPDDTVTIRLWTLSDGYVYAVTGRLEVETKE